MGANGTIRGRVQTLEKRVEAEGMILAILINAVFRVELADKSQVLARMSETMRGQFIRMLPGDRVKMEMSSGSPDKASIVLRLDSLLIAK